MMAHSKRQLHRLSNKLDIDAGIRPRTWEVGVAPPGVPATDGGDNEDCPADEPDA